MPRTVNNALTPLAVKSAPAGRYADGGGLYLLVKPTGAKSWLYRATIAGKVRDIGLGTAGPGGTTLADARNLARDKAREAKAGSVPLSDQRKQREAVKGLAQAETIASSTFWSEAEAFIALNEAEWRNPKHRAQWRSTLATYAYPSVGALLVGNISTEDVLAVLQPIWLAKPETASRLRGRIESVLDAARVKGLRSGENPARWRGHLEYVLPKPGKLSRGHHAAVPYADLPAFMADLAGREALAARALEFTLLTASRSGEVLGATWGEVDLEAATWTVPAARMKGGREHRVPLSRRAVAILQAVQSLNTRDSKSAPLFPATNGGVLSGMAMSMLMRRMGRTETVHGFRSTFRDWASETTGFPHDVCEMALAHTIGNKAEAAYRRGDVFDKRRELMTAWAAYAGSNGATNDNVTQIRTARCSGSQ